MGEEADGEIWVKSFTCILTCLENTEDELFLRYSARKEVGERTE